MIEVGDNMNDEELMHYGVLGMKWGVKRASKRLSKAKTSEERAAAIAKLNKHRAKATKKVTTLNKERARLEKRVNANATTTDVKVAKMERESARLKRKAQGVFVSEKQAELIMYKAMNLDSKASELKSLSNEAKTLLAKNKTITRQFEKGIADIDEIIRSKGKRVVGK